MAPTLAPQLAHPAFRPVIQAVAPHLGAPCLAESPASASFGLSLLLNAAAAALDRFWLVRAERDVGLLLPDYLDPGHDCPLAGAAGGEEAALRAELLQIGRQMRRVGLAAVTRAILEIPATPRRQAALLALAGSAVWQAVPGQAAQQRIGADGQVYLLASEAGRGASHAPHAMLALRQCLWILPAGTAAVSPDAAPAEQREDALDCLSLDLALRDVAFDLRAAEEADLAAQVLALCNAEAGLALAPAAPARAIAATAAA